MLGTFHFYFLAAVIQGVVLALLIFFRKPFKVPSVLLGLSIFLVSLSLLHGVLEESIHAFNARFPIPMNFGFALAPLVFLHVKSICFPTFKLKPKHLLHFIPTFLFDCLLFIGFFSYANNHMEWAMQHVEQIQLSALLLGSVLVIQALVYFVLMLRMIRLKNIQQDTNQDILKWLRITLISWMPSMVFLLIAIPIALINVERFDEYSYLMYKPLGIISALCIYLLGYLYLVKYRSIVTKYVNQAAKAKYAPGEVTFLANQLKEFLESTRIFNDEKLNVKKLAECLDWSEKDVSLIINLAFRTNFNDLINSYRVRSFKEMVRQPQNKKYSIMGIAQEAGFNSKASFYRAFKKECGQTPSEYLSS